MTKLRSKAAAFEVPNIEGCPPCGKAADGSLAIMAADLLNKRTRRMPASFGQGTEVVGRRVVINLLDVLAGGEDVSAWF